MAFDYKKEYKEYYLPKNKPQIVDIPIMNFIAVRGKGDPNEEGGEYKQALELLYGIAYTIKMSKKTDYRIEGYFDYVVPPLEGFWEQEGKVGIDYSRKSDLKWTAMIRVPDFVTKADFDWAVAQATEKKKLDFSSFFKLLLVPNNLVEATTSKSHISIDITVFYLIKFILEI